MRDRAGETPLGLSYRLNHQSTLVVDPAALANDLSRAYIKVNPVVDLENVIKGLQKSLPQRHHHLIPKNEAAIRRGMEIVREAKLTS